jgi:ABC-type lipoprotein export system ATPase subunit
MKENVFEIRGLECAYQHNNKTVLSIGELDIPKGKVTTILGKSGSGKSTFIETLGMMNNTIKQGLVRFSALDASETMDQKIWENPDALSLIRNKHFSFIFQDDYLMPYYTPWENILIGSLIQKASNPDKMKEQLHSSDDLEAVCLSLGLDINLLKKQMPYEMSGGQKQRLSFIRAITKDYSVIFGDEPTGNLDEDFSEVLMKVLEASVRKNKNRSAILVSHNIPLSIACSDRIIVLSPGQGTSYQVKPANVFDKKDSGWVNGKNIIYSGEELASIIRNIIRNKD